MDRKIKNKCIEWSNLSDDYDKQISVLDDYQLHECFYKDINFGTGGMRGIMGIGTNRINEITIKKVTYALGKVLFNNQLNNKKKQTVVIAYDTRKNSKIYAMYASQVLTNLGIITKLFKQPVPTPILSFAVRKFQADAGIVITASHNPKEYNGFKVYNSQGGQLIPNEANLITEEFLKIKNLKFLKDIEGDNNFLKFVDNDFIDDFINSIDLKKPNNTKLSIIYTPLHGSGLVPIQKILHNFQLDIVKKQTSVDGDFPTVESPNPEDVKAMTLAINEAIEKNADIVIGTDPDCDRLGVAVKHRGEYLLLTGNQIGALFIDYLTKNTSSNNQHILKTIVTNELGANIATAHGHIVSETLTGFKYIGEVINRLESDGKLSDFMMGYEESYGFLIGTHARDKDGVSSALLISLIANELKYQNRTLIDQLDNIYNEYGYYMDKLDSIKYDGYEGSKTIEQIMVNARKLGINISSEVIRLEDYSLGINNLPKENVIKYHLNNNSWFAIRPSGTEPKIKIYYSICDENKNKALKRLNTLREELKNNLNINNINS